MMIEVRNLCKKFGNFVALDHVSLNFPKGELIALLGPSGCGKTSLLRVIAGLEHVDDGQIFLDGEDTLTLSIRERNVGFVFQHYALFRHMTVFDNVAFGLRVKRKKERLSEKNIAIKVHELLNLVQLDWVHDRFPAQLSGGQRQRIALARALAVEPRVLLLDEPFGALDAKVRKELRRWLRRLHDDLHMTSIFVTHDQEEGLEVADRVVLMNKGRVEQIGTPDEVYNHPKTAFVYDFLGNANQFHGRINDQKISVGTHTLSTSEARLAEGTEVLAFVRPHQLEIVDKASMREGILVSIQRILSFGVLAKVQLIALSEEENGFPRYFEVELPRAELLAKKWYEGQEVRLVPSQVKVFEQP